ncbi:hypothetical protein CF326_g7357 [Tilletia indica]|nr:hypothetical protein CF326_g7357 [Tilletia indica]
MSQIGAAPLPLPPPAPGQPGGAPLPPSTPTAAAKAGPPVPEKVTWLTKEEEKLLDILEEVKASGGAPENGIKVGSSIVL